MPVIPYPERPEPFSRQPWWLAILAVMELVFALALFGLLLAIIIIQGPPKNDGLELRSSCYSLLYPGIIAVRFSSEVLDVAQCWMLQASTVMPMVAWAFASGRWTRKTLNSLIVIIFYALFTAYFLGLVGWYGYMYWALMALFQESTESTDSNEFDPPGRPEDYENWFSRTQRVTLVLVVLEAFVIPISPSWPIEHC